MPVALINKKKNKGGWRRVHTIRTRGKLGQTPATCFCGLLGCARKGMEDVGGMMLYISEFFIFPFAQLLCAEAPCSLSSPDLRVMSVQRSMRPNVSLTPSHAVCFFLSFFLPALAQPAQAMFSAPAAALPSSKKQPLASSQRALFAASPFHQTRCVSSAWILPLADGVLLAATPISSLAVTSPESSLQSVRNISCASTQTPAQSRRHVAWRTR